MPNRIGSTFPAVVSLPRTDTPAPATPAPARAPTDERWAPRAAPTRHVQEARTPSLKTGEPRTFSEALQDFRALAKNDQLSRAAREAAVEKLEGAVQRMGIGGKNPFMPLVDKASADALGLHGAERLAFLAGRSARRALDTASGALSPPMPTIRGRIQLDHASARRPGPQDTLSAHLVTTAYDDSVSRITSNLSTQFDSAKVVDGAPFEPLGGRALVGTRTSGDLPITMIGFRGTNNAVDAARDLAMGCATLTPEGPCFTLQDGAQTGYGAGAVHTGFAAHLDTLWPSLRGEVLEAAKHDRTVEFTGHSLGAATAELAMARALNDPEVRAALEHSKADPRASLVTYAQPSVGDAAFEKKLAADLAKLDIPARTYGFRDDPVMQAPPTGLPDARGRSFARPSYDFVRLDSTGGRSLATVGRGQESVKQQIRTDLAGFLADAAAFATTASSDEKNGYSKLADHAPQNYLGVVRNLPAT